MSTRAVLVVFLWLTACGTDPSANGKPGLHTGSPAPDSAVPEVDSAVDTADSGTEPDPDAPTPYCRSLDPDWASAYTSSLDAALAEIIDSRELLGDPRLYVDADGNCRRRDLPSIDEALPQLGRRLFFSSDLSGDRDVACATCHHPLLGGADALILPAGPGFEATAVGEDRVRGLTDISKVHNARNTPSIMNVALWDHRLMWDGRVEALDPEAGFNGDVGGISTPDGLSEAPNLVAAQALLPIQHPFEMAGGLADTTESGDALLEIIVARLEADPSWQAAFEAVCAADDPLPESWTTACTSVDLPLVTAAHLGEALAAYQRSLVFVDTPWSAYVQGDLDAIPEHAKVGALAFFRSPAEGGLNCGACHTGDFFTDEDLHSIASPQLGPGNPYGTGVSFVDLGRGELTGSPEDNRAFRTPSLLNVAHTAPYFHSGSVPSLFRAIFHYRDVQGSLDQTFGFSGEPLRQDPIWCRTALFADIPGCPSLYTVDATWDGDLSVGVDGELEDIGDTLNLSTDYVVLFLEALEDPRSGDAEALAPWIESGDDVPTPTESSDPWPQTCRSVIEWSQEMDLRVKGARWLGKGALLPGMTVNSGLRMSEVFGLGYWEMFGRRYELRSGVSREPTTVAAGVLALLTPAERAGLIAQWVEVDWDGTTRAWRTAREAVFEQMNTWRESDQSVDSAALAALLQTVWDADQQNTLAMVRGFGSAAATLSSEERAVRAHQLGRYLDGHFDELPPDIIGASSLALPDEVRLELAADGIDYSVAFADYVVSYATWMAGPDCTGAFDPRQDSGGQMAAYFGYSGWVSRAFFNLQTGSSEPLTPQKELAGLIESLENEAGSTQMATSLPALNAAQRSWTSAHQQLASTVRQLGEALAASGDVDDAERNVEQAVAAMAEAEARVLAVELDYLFHLRDTLSTEQMADLVGWIDCLESAETQALHDAGGFDGAGGGSCLP